MIVKLILLALVAIWFVSLYPAYGQVHAGHNLAPPIDFGGMKVALSTILSPQGFTAEDAKSANLAIRFFDSETDTNIKSVTYRVQIFYNEELLANEYFFDDDGKLDLEIRPISGCQLEDLWKCTKYLGEKHPIAGAYYARGDLRPIIQGPVFDKSGDYRFKVDIVGATNPRTMTVSDLSFETLLSIPLKQSFLIKNANAEEFPISIKSFTDELTNFSFDINSKKISYELPMNWKHMLHDVQDIKQSIHFKKDFDVFNERQDVEVYVEGIKLQSHSILFDTSGQNENVLGISIPHEEVMLISAKLNKQTLEKNNMKIEILSGNPIQFSKIDFAFENGYTANVKWDSKMQAGQKIPFTFSFQDSNGKPLQNILYAYSLTDATGKEFLVNIGTSETVVGILAKNGISHESVLIPSEGNYQLKLILTGDGNTNFKKFLADTADFRISLQNPSTKEVNSIPTWIKNNAGWWAEGKIDDSSFVQGIQYLVKEGIIKVS